MGAAPVHGVTCRHLNRRDSVAKTLFLPGASGSAAFWKPVADRLVCNGRLFAWPGLGREPAQQGIESFDDLITMVKAEIDTPVAIVAQSMGGYIALQVALALPAMVTRLVLVATSGGLPVQHFGGQDWRQDYSGAFPMAARWVAQPGEDLSARLPQIPAPTLLLWGGADPISPPAVGERLRGLLPAARLLILPGAGHDLAQTHAATVADQIRRHLDAAG